MKTQEQHNETKGNYKEILKKRMDEYVRFVYRVTKSFPKEELYGSVSQWRRSTLSIALNYIEGYARKKSLVQLNFYENAYGSFKESKYLLYFAHGQAFLSDEEYREGLAVAEEIGAMLWTEMHQLEISIKR